MVGLFDCVGRPVSAMVDIAIDRAGKMTGWADLVQQRAGRRAGVDRSTSGHCTVLTRGPDLVTSLTYVPEGTLVANAEALVGYADDGTCASIPRPASSTDIGLLNNAASGGVRWLSSGDVVSIKDGGTYLTVKPESGRDGGRRPDRRGRSQDRRAQADHRRDRADDVLGLGYWGGIAYGFTLAGA